MKKFTLIEVDMYQYYGLASLRRELAFADIEHLWAIQWKDDGTEDCW